MSKRKKRKQKKTLRRKHKQSRLVAQKQQVPQGTGNHILNDWAQQLREEGRLEDAELVVNPPGHDKLSDNLLELLGDYTKVAETVEEMRKLISIASVAWNATLIPEQGREDFLESLLKDPTDDLNEFIDYLMARKLSLYPGIKRFILDYKVVIRGDGFYVSVVSTLTK